LNKLVMRCLPFNSGQTFTCLSLARFNADERASFF
jgi:hypothetical protein